MLEQIALCEELASEVDCLAGIEPSQRKSVEIHTKALRLWCLIAMCIWKSLRLYISWNRLCLYGGTVARLEIWRCVGIKQGFPAGGCICQAKKAENANGFIISFLPARLTARNNRLTKYQVPLGCAQKAIHLLSLFYPCCKYSKNLNNKGNNSSFSVQNITVCSGIGRQVCTSPTTCGKATKNFWITLQDFRLLLALLSHKGKKTGIKDLLITD